MKTQTYRNLWLALLLVLFAFPLAVLADNSAGPLTWQASRVPSTYPAQEAVKRASQYLGVSDAIKPVAPPQFVQVTDVTPYGNISKTVFYAWLLSMPVSVSNANSKAAAVVDVTVLVNARDKGLDAAFTAKNARKWIAPYSSFKELNPFQLVADDGWRIEQPLSVQTRSSVSQVLSSFWSTTGISPEEAGQIFLRPRHVTLALPAKRVGAKLVPLRKPGTYWVVRVNGTKTLEITPPPNAEAGPAPSGEIPYMSGLIALFDDDGAQSVRGVYLP